MSIMARKLQQASSSRPTPPNVCVSPIFQTSAHHGGVSNGGYYIDNDMWNEGMTLGPQTLSVCSYKSWYAVSNQTNQGGAVLTYPNVHKDYHDWADPNDGSQDPLISSFSQIMSTFSYISPNVGAYNVAYDIWLNGVASANCTEVMIWTENHQPAYTTGNAGTMTLDGHNYHIITQNSNHYIAIIADSPVSSGTIDILSVFNQLVSRGLLASGSTMGQLCFGIEFSHTGGTTARFDLTDFSITSA